MEVDLTDYHQLGRDSFCASTLVLSSVRRLSTIDSQVMLSNVLLDYVKSICERVANFEAVVDILVV